jgi:2-dehydro-3-deoxygluconokinase
MPSMSRMRDAAECRYGLVALGEVMPVVDAGDGRISTARELRAWKAANATWPAVGDAPSGGGTAVMTAFAGNEVGRLLED